MASSAASIPPPPSPLPIHPPVAVLSDLHLAHPASYLGDPARLMPLLGPARTVVFNGDTCELLNVQRRKRSEEMLERLIEACIDRGARPIFLTGNHDPNVSSLHYLDLFDGRVFLTHGDCLHPMVAPWSKEGPVMWEERLRLLCGAPDPVELEPMMQLIKRTTLVAAVYQPNLRKKLLARAEILSRFIYRPHRILLTLDYWANVAHFSHEIKMRHRPEAKLMLIGHTHRHGVWQARDYTLINTGSYQPLSRPLVVLMDDRRAKVYKVRGTADGWRLGRELHQVKIR